MDGGSKEGKFLLGPATFEGIGKGRVRCVETGHEVVEREKEAYGSSKGCRIGMIDFAVRNRNPPLNTFNLDPTSRSKLICKLTGYTINKTEEHIWKHITGKRFLHKLEQKEMEKAPASPAKNKKTLKKKKVNKNKLNAEKALKKELNESENVEAETPCNGCDSEDVEFWTPPVGERWDFDDGKNRWNSCSSSNDNENEDGADEMHESEEEADNGVEEVDDGIDSGDISIRTKRMSIAIGPSSFATRKKKSRKDSN